MSILKILVSDRTRRALSNGILRFQMFSSACGSSKIVLQATDEQGIPLDRARPVVSGTSIFRIDTVKKVNISSFYSNIMPEFY